MYTSRRAPRRSRRTPATVMALAAVAAFVPTHLVAQSGSQADTLTRILRPLVVTVTRTPVLQFDAPQPVNVFSASRIGDGLINSIPDLFPSAAGLDVTGVGVQQVRPVIRGQKGQRILLLQDGMRLNNSRRQQDFGEIPSLVDPSTVQRVEVVRGPSSVLYGTDAIGGVVNIITKRPQAEGLTGAMSYRFGQLESQHRGSVQVAGRFGPWDLQLDGTLREAGDYAAPAGRVGDIVLETETDVENTGVEDETFSARVGYQIHDGHRVWTRAERYDGKDGGFGVVAPAAYGAGGPTVRIRYPDQEFTKFTFGYEASDLANPLAEEVQFLAYRQRNERTLSFLLTQSFGPGAGMRIENVNYSDLTTNGFRVEAKKGAAENLRFTYGADGFFDDSENSDFSSTMITGFGPPVNEEDDTPQVPNASFRSLGVFTQAEVDLGDRLGLVAGGRVQDLHAESRTTPGLDVDLLTASETTVVGALNALFRATDRFHVIATVGRGFRAPNLVELFFEGAVPEGSGFQVPNAALGAETSLNFDLGGRFQGDRMAVEAFYFRNRLEDAIRIAPTGDTRGGLPAFQNVNVDEVVIRGIEVSGQAVLPDGFSLEGGFSWLDSDESEDGTNPVGETYANKINGAARWQSPRLWTEYAVRHQGDRDEAGLADNPIGDVLPGFTVHSIRAGARLFESGPLTHRITVGIENLTDQLYSDFANAAFFRPAPGRSLVVQFDVMFQGAG